jgi:hypothetical protein
VLVWSSNDCVNLLRIREGGVGNARGFVPVALQHTLLLLFLFDFLSCLH